MANITIPNLPSLSIVNDPDLMIINAGGLSSKTTVADFLSNVRADLTSISVSLDNKVNATNTTVLNSLTASVIQLNQSIVSNSAALAQQISVVNVGHKKAHGKILLGLASSCLPSQNDNTSGWLCAPLLSFAFTCIFLRHRCIRGCVYRLRCG